MKKRYIALLVAFAVLALIFLAYTGVFFYYRNSFVKKYTQGMTYDKTDGSYMEEIKQPDELDNIYCTAFVPHFFSNDNAHLAYEQAETVEFNSATGEDNGIVREHFKADIVFPRFFKEPIVRVRLDYKDENGSMQRVFFEMDTQMNLLNEEETSSVTKKMYKELEPRIKEVYHGIYDKWGICKLEEFN